MTFEEALQRLNGLDVDFVLQRSKYSYGEVKRGWSCRIDANSDSKYVGAYGSGSTSAEACIDAVGKFFEVQSDGISLAAIKAVVASSKVEHLSA